MIWAIFKKSPIHGIKIRGSKNSLIYGLKIPRSYKNSFRVIKIPTPDKIFWLAKINHMEVWKWEMKGLRFLVLVSRFGFEFDFWPWDVIGPPEPVDRDLIFKIKLPKFVDFELLVNYSEAISRPFDRPLKSNIYCFLEINLPPRKKRYENLRVFQQNHCSEK